MMLLWDLLMLLLGKVLGCPCCRAPWYRNLSVRWYQAHGFPVPPELGGTGAEYSPPEGP